MTQPKAVWTHFERMIVRKYYRKSTDAELLEMLPGKSQNQIRSQASFLGVRRGVRVNSSAYMRYKSDREEPQNVDAEKDAEHVSACLSHGGFPSTQIISGQTVWVWPKMELAA